MKNGQMCVCTVRSRIYITHLKIYINICGNQSHVDTKSKIKINSMMSSHLNGFHSRAQAGEAHVFCHAGMSKCSRNKATE